MIRYATLLSGLAIGVFFPANAAHAEWQNALKPVGESAGDIVLVKDGKPQRVIRIAAAATTMEINAADELRHWIEQITSARAEIVTAVSGPSIRLTTDESLGEEGYRVAVEKDDLVLAGGTGRGVMNAVYALLEEDLGCRFYTNESIRLPKGSTLVVKPVSRTFAPTLRLRDPFYHCAFDSTWSLRNRTNAPRAEVSEEYGGHIDYDGLFVHTHKTLLPPEKYFKDHPDYFALDKAGKRYPAQLCATNPEVAKIVTAVVLETLRQNPRAEIVSVSKNDNPGNQICYCDRCRKIREEEGSDMGCQLVLVNTVADAVAKEFPHVSVDTLAYLETLPPPKHARPRPNVVIRLCDDVVGAWSHPFTPARENAVAKAMADWSQIHNRFYIWDYNVNFSHYLAPMPNLDVMAANIRFWVENHAEGVMLQGGHQGPAADDEMKAWVSSKLLWDPTRNEKALEQDFIWGHYGPAAPALAEYEDLLDSLRTTYAAEMKSPPGGIRYPMNVPFYPKRFIKKATRILNRAKELAAGDEQIQQRVERAELSILYVKCVRGPDFAGTSYADDVAAFERIARREKVKHLGEGAPTLDTVLAQWKSRIPKDAPKAP